MNVNLSDLRIDGGTQPREVIEEAVVSEYADAMADGANFPPIVVFFDGATYWLADGFHRYHAARQLGLANVTADIREGTRREAVLFSVGANATHGLRRTNEDKRRAVMRLLEDEEWRGKSDHEIARLCVVTQTLVSNMRRELTKNGFQSPAMRKGADGRTINTANIGQRPKEYGPDFNDNYTIQEAYERSAHPLLRYTSAEPQPDYDDEPEYDDLPADEPESEPEETQPETRSMAKSAYITLPQWANLGDEARRILLTPTTSGATFNAQKNDNIEWARWSWNPVTGCKHDCPYCYARDIAARFYEQGFEPSFLPDRLSAPRNTNVPAVAMTDIGYKNVFACSMADLFGRWVPTEWIEAVLDAVRAAPQWNFLFLTKFPIRLSEFDFPDNAWVGTTVDCQIRVKNAERAFSKVRAKVKWLSCEPLLEPLEFSDLGMFQWLVIGGSSASSQTPAWNPPRSWVTRIEAKALEVGCKVYEKTNLFAAEMRLREYPGGDSHEPRLPDALRYLPSIE